MRLIYLDSAQTDLKSIAIFVATASQNRMVAVQFVHKLREKCRRLADLPGTHGSDRSDIRPALRSTPCGNYIIFFRYAADAVEIVNILHASRDVMTYHEADD